MTRARFRLLLLASLVLVPGVTEGQDDPPPPRGAGVDAGGAGVDIPLPRPDLSSAEPSVREQIDRTWQRLEALSRTDPAAARPLPADGVEPGELAEAVGQLARLYHAYQFEAAATVAYAHAERLDPEDPVWPYLRAVILQRDRRLADAESALRRVLALAPDQLPARLRLAEILRLAGRGDEAEAELRSLFEAPTGEARGPRLGSADEAVARYGLGRLLASRGELDEAIVQLEAALEAAPGASAIRQHLGSAHRRQGELERARTLLSQAGPVEPAFADPWAVDLLPTGATARLLMGNRAFRLGQLARARVHHRAAYEADPENPAVLRALALTLERSAAPGSTPGALPGSDSASEARQSEARQSEARQSEALRLYDRARRLAPDDPLLLFDFARAHLAARADGSPEIRSRALEALRRAVELAPSYTAAHLLLAAEATRAGELATAAEHFEAAERSSPGHPEARRGLLLVLYGQATKELETARLEPALARLERLLMLDPRHLDGHRLAAEVSLRLGQEARAARAYEAALRLVSPPLAISSDSGPDSSPDPGPDPGPDPAGVEAELALGLARLRAAAIDPSVRDSRRALELARRGFELRPSPEGAEVMAMALASAGGFEQAVAWQARLLEQARAGGAPPDYLERLESNLARYRQGRPAPAP